MDVLVPLSCIAGLVLAVYSPFFSQRSNRNVEMAGALALFTYVVAAEFACPFGPFAYHGQRLIRAIWWLCPLIIGGVVLPTRGAWLVGAGYWLALFGGTLAIVDSAAHSMGGSLSFFQAWRG
jgi:hypothetical protein